MEFRLRLSGVSKASTVNNRVFGRAPGQVIERVRSSSKTVPNSWSNSQITIGIRRSSALRFRLFEAEEVNVAAGARLRLCGRRR